MSEKPDYVPGLAGIPAARSSVCLIDGAAGKLQYRGYPAEQLAEHCTFEEVTYLLLFGELPTRPQLESFTAELARERHLKFRIIDVLKQLPESGHPMDALTAAVAVMGMFYADGDHVEDPTFRRLCAVRLVAKLPTVVAAWHRIRRGDNPIEPRADLGHAANFLYMLDGKEPDAIAARIMDAALVLHAEHSMNASTFTCRVTASTLADPYAAVASAIGSLAGPLHGGANEVVLTMLRTIPDASPEAVRRWAEDKLARKEKIMGFGHRVYKVKDPRADILQGLAVQLFEELGHTPIYDVAIELERQEARPRHRQLHAGVRDQPRVRLARAPARAARGQPHLPSVAGLDRDRGSYGPADRTTRLSSSGRRERTKKPTTRAWVSSFGRHDVG